MSTQVIEHAKCSQYFCIVWCYNLNEPWKASRSFHLSLSLSISNKEGTLLVNAQPWIQKECTCKFNTHTQKQSAFLNEHKTINDNHFNLNGFKCNHKNPFEKLSVSRLRLVLISLIKWVLVKNETIAFAYDTNDHFVNFVVKELFLIFTSVHAEWFSIFVRL